MRDKKQADPDHARKMNLVKQHNTTFANVALFVYAATATPLVLSWNSLNDSSPLLAKTAFLLVAGINIASLAFMNSNMIHIDKVKGMTLDETLDYRNKHPHHPTFQRR